MTWTAPDLLGPYELLHRIAHRKGAKVLLRSNGNRRGNLRLMTLVVRDPVDEVPLALAPLQQQTLDEAALSCLRQLKVRV